MSSGSFRQADVVCPFYREDNGSSRIICEGVGASSTLTIFYRSRRAYEKQIGVFCCEHYSKCEIARAIMEKYE